MSFDLRTNPSCLQISGGPNLNLPSRDLTKKHDFGKEYFLYITIEEDWYEQDADIFHMKFPFRSRDLKIHVYMVA